MAGALVLLSIVLITIYFRESSGGGLHGVQSTGAAVLRPFEVGAERVAAPFRDGYDWFAGPRAREVRERAPARGGRQVQPARDPEQDRGPGERRPQAPARASSARREFPRDYNYVATDIISRSPSDFQQQVMIAARLDARGSASTTRSSTPDGLIGIITHVASHTAQVTLLTDPKIKVSAVDLRTRATGIVSAGQGRGTLTLERVSKSQSIRPDDLIVTQGWRDPGR